MTKQEMVRPTRHKLATGVVRKVPTDLARAISADPKANDIWEDITPLAKNEWICWVTSGKKEETRSIRIEKVISKLTGGMRRPCCWAGCPHYICKQ
ncbi:MAG: YdeI/OmpD-associated family protein [Patescibacteria group bacterium]